MESSRMDLYRRQQGYDGRGWGLEDGDGGWAWIPEREDGRRQLDLGLSVRTAAGSQAECEDVGDNIRTVGWSADMVATASGPWVELEDEGIGMGRKGGGGGWHG